MTRIASREIRRAARRALLVIPSIGLTCFFAMRVSLAFAAERRQLKQTIVLSLD